MAPTSLVKNQANERPVLTVTQLNKAVGELLSESFVSIWVKGELSNFTQAASGHWYFTLKDDSAAVRAVMFKARAQAVGFVPASGDAVEVRARVTIYEPRGDYQLQIDQMRRAGVGNLYEAFLALKAKLQGEGLFDPAGKRPIMKHPKAIGVITSLGAAALRDVLTALARRAPHVPVIIYPSPVQGAGAPLQLRQALARANARQEVDTILLVRGGGSIEDLWSFNDENLARDVASSLIPVICGVGHETDFSIADFAADLRAPTPTAAAELACISRDVLLSQVHHALSSFGAAWWRLIERKAQQVDRATAGLIHPGERLARQRERQQHLAIRIRMVLRQYVEQQSSRLAHVDAKLSRLRPDLTVARLQLKQSLSQLQQRMKQRMESAHARLNSAVRQVQALSPENTLARGYAIAMTVDGKVVKSADTLAVGQPLGLMLGNGEALVRVEEVQRVKRQGSSVQADGKSSLTGDSFKSWGD